MSKTLHGDDDKSTKHEVVYEPIEEYFEEIPIWVAILTYVSYAILIVFGHFRDLLRYWHVENMPTTSEPHREVSVVTFII